MAFSARKLQVCCALLPVMRFTAFLPTRLLGWASDGRAARDNRGFPRRAMTPRSLPSPAAVPRHQGRSLRAVETRLRNSPRRTVSGAPQANSSGDPLGFEVFLRLRVRDDARPFPASTVLSFRGLDSPSRFSPARRHSVRMAPRRVRFRTPPLRSRPKCLRP
jgi:hypothetical protein